MGFVNPPSSCSFVYGRFQHIKEIDEKIRKQYKNSRKFHLFGIFAILLLIFVGAYVFNCVFGGMFKKIMHDRVNRIVEDQINAYRNISSERTLELSGVNVGDIDQETQGLN